MKVAVQISGQGKDFKNVYSTLKEHLLDKLGDYDIFIHNWDTDKRKVSWCGDEKIKVSDDNFKEMLDIFKPKKYLRECFDEFYENSYLEQKKDLCVKYGNNIFSYTSQNVIPQLYGWYKCNEIRKQYQNETNIEYDIIFKIRADIFYCDNVIDNISQLNFVKENKILIIPLCHAGILSYENPTRFPDLIGFSTPDVMNNYLDVYKNIENSTNKGDVIDTHNIVYNYINKNNINYLEGRYIGYITNQYVPWGDKGKTQNYKEWYKNKESSKKEFYDKIIPKRGKNHKKFDKTSLFPNNLSN